MHRVLLIASCLAALVMAAPASAHVTVAATSPAAGSTASKAIRAVRVRFSGPIRSGTLIVRTASGTKVSIGAGGRDPRNVARLLVALRSGLAAGRYSARWTCVAADGHRQSGSFSFRLR